MVRFPTAVSPLSAWLLSLWAACLLATHGSAAESGLSAAKPPPPVTIRIAWGGGRERAWRGAIRLVPAEGGAVGEIVAVASLCGDKNPEWGLRRDRREIRFGDTPPRGFDGFDLTLEDWQGCHLVVEIDGTESPFSTRLDEPVVQLALRSRQQAIDRDGNRLSVGRAPGDELRVSFGPDGGEASAVRAAGEPLVLTVAPALAARSGSGSQRELSVALVDTRSGSAVVTRNFSLAAVPGSDLAGSDGHVLRQYETVVSELPVPDAEGVYRIDLTLLETGSLRWARPLASRSVEFVALAREPMPTVATVPWDTIYEFDAGSPRLFDRLRRLSGISAMPTVPLPAVPALDVPSVGDWAKLPGISRLPGLAESDSERAVLPGGRDGVPRAMDAFFPRFSGPLPGGQGLPTKHPHGMMLRLPPSSSRDRPSWEAIVIPGAEPGRPHLLEIEYPTDQDLAVGVCVIEPNAAGLIEPVVWGGGFEARRPLGDPAEPVARYQQVFWPRTKTPLVVLTNLSPREDALVGRLRVTAGPERLTPAVANPPPDTSRKRLLGLLATPEFSRFGVTARVDAETGRPVDDWGMFLEASRRMVDLLAHRGAAGALVGVYADGAPTWPSEVHAGGGPWDNGRLSLSGQDPASKDLLGLLCRIYAREGLELLPAIECQGPLADLEALRLAGGSEAVGITCQGSHGESYTGNDGELVYNILDPRVQQAVERLVRDLAKRVAGESAVSGIALVCPHDGWLHLPGLAWPLDDATMARFAADTGAAIPSSGSSRFLERATLVSGPLKESWIEWRCEQIAAFHARLADAIAAEAGDLDLQFVPTTLFADGPLASRFHPSLATTGGDIGLLREIGLDTAKLTEHPRVVFVGPQAHGGATELVSKSRLRAANRSSRLAAASALAARRGGIHVERAHAVGLDGVLAAAPFSAGQAAAGVTAAIQAAAVGIDADEAVTGLLDAADVEFVVDDTLLCQMDAGGQVAARHLTALPSGPLETLPGVPAPLVVRHAATGDGLVAAVINASPVGCVAGLQVTDAGDAAVDAADGQLISVVDGGLEVPLGPWQLRTLRFVPSARLGTVEVDYDPSLQPAILARLASLRQRRGVLEYPVTMEVLDNPGFELPVSRGQVPGWELVEPSRGTVAAVAGREDDSSQAGQRRPPQAVCFASKHGLSTFRSNPFAPPTTGRVSVAVWLRIEEGNPQPPLRIAVEGLQGRGEYYRFAAVGRGDGAIPLTSDWSQVVLQVDDLPTQGLEALRVRLDLLGPGKVHVDDVRVYDLAFDEGQRVQLSKILALIDHQLSAGDLGSCVLELDGHWPRFLEAHIDEKAVVLAVEEEDRQRTAAEQAARPPERTGMFDRIRQWWQ